MLDASKFAKAGALTAGILYVVCAVVVWLLPDFSLQLLGWVAHLVNVDKFAGDVQVTLVGAFWGLVQILVYAYVSFWLFAKIHNRV